MTIKLKEVLHIRVGNSLYKKLDALAREDKRDISTYVRLMIEETLEAMNKNGSRITR